MTTVAPVTILSVTSRGYLTYSDTVTVPRGFFGAAFSALWAGVTPAVVTFDSGVKASKAIADLTYTADIVGTAGNSITVQYLDSIKASKVIQDITYTADAKGSGGNAITVAYTSGGSAGAEVVTVGGSAISVAVQDQASYAVKTFVTGTASSKIIQDLTYVADTRGVAGDSVTVAYANTGFGGQESSSAAVSAITVAMQGVYASGTFVSGIAPFLLSNGLTFTSVVRDTGVYLEVDFDGGGTAGAEAVTLSGTGTALDPYKILIVVESGVSTAAQVKTAYDLVAAVTAIATVAVTTPGTVTPTVSTPLAGGVNSGVHVGNNTLAIAGHTLVDGVRVRLTSPGGTLPDPLATGTDYWVVNSAPGLIKLGATFGGGAVNLTDQGTSGGTFTVVPKGTSAAEIKTAVEADAPSAALVDITVSGTGTNQQIAQVATALAGGVNSSVNQTANTITVPTHGYTTGNKVAVTGGTLPTNLVTPSWVIVIDGSTLKFATSYANAMGATAIDIASDGDATTTYTLTPAYSTATMVKAAVDASVAAAALVDTSITGTAGNFQAISAVANLAGGYGGAGASAQVVVTASAIQVYLETGVTTAAQVKTVVDASVPAAALVDVSVTGNGAAAQVVTAATPLENGVDNDFTKSTEALPNRVFITGHTLVTGSLFALTTGGGLPAGLAAQNYYAIRIDDNTLKFASSLANALAGTAVPITGDGTGQHTVTAAAFAATLSLQWSVDNSLWEDVPTGYGGEAVNMAGQTSNIWTVNSIQPQYFRLKLNPSGGQITCTAVSTVK
jgi:hypothetical protein